jgi:hypothetical protein
VADAWLFGGGGGVGHNHGGAAAVDGEEEGNSEEVVGIDARAPTPFKHAISSPASSAPDPPRPSTRPISSTTLQTPPPSAEAAPQAGVIRERQQTEETSSAPSSWVLPARFPCRSCTRRRMQRRREIMKERGFRPLSSFQTSGTAEDDTTVAFQPTFFSL